MSLTAVSSMLSDEVLEPAMIHALEDPAVHDAILSEVERLLGDPRIVRAAVPWGLGLAGLVGLGVWVGFKLGRR